MPGATPQPAKQEGHCSEKARLLHRYQIAAADYSRAVMVLSKRAGVLSHEEYTRIRNFSEAARLGAEAARQALEQHVDQHRC
jgi:hypothetical protein